MFTKLLIPLDRSPLAEQAIGHAAAIARACHAAVDVMLVSQSREFPVLDDERASDGGEVRRDEQYVRTIANELARTAAISTTHAVLRGNIVAGIAARARAIAADLIVMTSHGRTGLSRAWLGSVADGVIRSSRTPVLVLRPLPELTAPRIPRDLYRKILVPLDGSVAALEILEAVGALAHCNNAHITLLRVIRPVPLITADASLAFVYPMLLPDEVATAGLVEQAQVELAHVAVMLATHRCTDIEQHVIVADHVAQAVLDFARASCADMIAMSTHGRGASRVVIGSMADKVMRGSGLPVLLYRPMTATPETLIDSARAAEWPAPATVL